MKRTFDDIEQPVSNSTRSKRPRITESYESFYNKLDKVKEKPWVSAFQQHHNHQNRLGINSVQGHIMT